MNRATRKKRQILRDRRAHGRLIGFMERHVSLCALGPRCVVPMLLRGARAAE